MSLAWGQAAETRTLPNWPCVEKPSHYKHLMLQVLCLSSEASWNSWKNCRWRRWVRDEAGETYAVLDSFGVLQREVSLLCVVVNETLYQPQEADTRNHFQPGSKQVMMIGCFCFWFFSLKKCSAGSGWACEWDSMVEIDVSCVKLSSEPSRVNCSDRRALLPGSLMVRHIHCWREDSHGVLKMPRRSHRPYKSFIRTLEKFFFFMWNRRTQRVLN